MAHRQSSIDRLPEDIRTKLQELLRDPRVTQLEAVRQINEILEQDGLAKLSKSAVNRYSLRMDKVGEKLRQSREVAKMWIGKLGAEPQGEVGKLLNEMVRTLAFETTMQMTEGGEPVEPKMLKDMSIAIERLEKAASENVKREEEIRKQAQKEAMEAIEETGKDKVLTAERIQEIKEMFGL